MLVAVLTLASGTNIPTMSPRPKFSQQHHQQHCHRNASFLSSLEFSLKLDWPVCPRIKKFASYSESNSSQLHPSIFRIKLVWQNLHSTSACSLQMKKLHFPALRVLAFEQSFISIGGTTLNCIIWSLVDTHSSATFGFGFNGWTSTTLECNTWSRMEPY